MFFQGKQRCRGNETAIGEINGLAEEIKRRKPFPHLHLDCRLTTWGRLRPARREAAPKRDLRGVRKERDKERKEGEKRAEHFKVKLLLQCTVESERGSEVGRRSPCYHRYNLFLFSGPKMESEAFFPLDFSLMMMASDDKIESDPSRQKTAALMR